MLLHDTDFFDRNDYRADRFQIVRDCSIVSIVNNRKYIRVSGTGVLNSTCLKDKYPNFEVGL